jgi:hypothetical protein
MAAQWTWASLLQPSATLIAWILPVGVLKINMQFYKVGHQDDREIICQP